MGYKLSIEQLIYMHRIKDAKLVSLIDSEYSKDPMYSNITSINLFIDLYSIFNRLYGDNYDIENYNDISRNVLNMCISYRIFFRKYYDTHAIIYLIDSNNCCEINRKFYQDYNKGYAGSIINNKKATEIIYHNREILNTLCPYLEDMTYIGSNYETGVAIYDIIRKNMTMNMHNNPNLLLTKDVYNFQLATISNIDLRILRPKKWNGEDNSYSINQFNALNTYAYNRVNHVINTNIINYELLTYLMSITRMPERNMRSLISVPKAVEKLQKLINQNIIMNCRNTDIDRLTYLLCQDDINPINPIMVDFRFKAIDILYQHGIYITDPNANIYNGIINLYDPEAIKEINQEFFSSNPLDLMNV